MIKRKLLICLTMATIGVSLSFNQAKAGKIDWDSLRKKADEYQNKHAGSKTKKTIKTVIKAPPKVRDTSGLKKIILTTKDKRHCKYCDKFVYKVDNEFMIQKMQNENKCFAISNHFLEKMNDDKYTNLKDRLSISMLFLVYKSYRKEEFQEFIDNNASQEFILKAIVLDILNSYDIQQTVEWYAKNGVDLEIILHQVLSSVNDDKLKMQVEEKITKLIKKDTEDGK